MSKNKLVIAAAGSGKTTSLVKAALQIKDKNVLIVTFTEANEEEIKRKVFLESGSLPSNVTVQTWFSFLLEHGVRPYQGGIFEERVNGLSLVSGQSKKFTRESDIEKYYFDHNHRIYSDKLSRFVLKCDKQNNGEVIKRLTRIFPYVFIDEVQDLAGYDLELLKLLFASSANIVLVGDPRQGTYSTNNSAKHKQYKKSQIVHFFDNSEIQNNLEIDRDSLTINYRSNQKICDFANRIFPDHVPVKSGQINVTSHDGVFLVCEESLDNYLTEYPSCVQLRDSVREKRPRKHFPIINYGNSKGSSFGRILIYPTAPIIEWIKDNAAELAPTSRSKFYVAVTRAMYSVGIVFNCAGDDEIVGISKYAK